MLYQYFQYQYKGNKLYPNRIFFVSIQISSKNIFLKIISLIIKYMTGGHMAPVTGCALIIEFVLH